MAVRKRSGLDLLNEEVPSGHVQYGPGLIVPSRASLAHTETAQPVLDTLPGGLEKKDKLRQRNLAQRLPPATTAALARAVQTRMSREAEAGCSWAAVYASDSNSPAPASPARCLALRCTTARQELPGPGQTLSCARGSPGPRSPASSRESDPDPGRGALPHA